MNMKFTGIKSIHPGVTLAQKLAALQLAPAQLAQHLGLEAALVQGVLDGQQPVTPEMALLFARVFNEQARYWTDLQTTFDLIQGELRLAGYLFQLQVLTPELLQDLRSAASAVSGPASPKKAQAAKKAGAKTGVKVGTKASAKAGTKTKEKAVAKTKTKASAKPETKSSAQTKTKASAAQKK